MTLSKAQKMLRHAHKLVRAEEMKKDPPKCACGCGERVTWNKKGYWNTYLKGHGNRKYNKQGTAPKCACGCGQPVLWVNGKGWNTHVAGHSRKNVKATEETKRKMSESMRNHYKGKRRRDLEESPGVGVYATQEYREARDRLVKGKPCKKCGSTQNIHAHHEIPGDDESLVPLCVHCHPTAHATPGAKGKNPPPGEIPPLCACGCGREVKWKRVRGWAKFCKGHGSAKVPAVSQFQDPPLCKCGCGRPVTYRHGIGWREYVRGHRQRVEGHYTSRAQIKPVIACEADIGSSHG